MRFDFIRGYINFKSYNITVKVEFQEKTFLSKKEKKITLELWNSEYPKNLNYSTLSQFNDYLEVLNEQFHILILLDGDIKGWYFDFLREGEKWFGLILHSDLQGKGVGTYILSHVKKKRRELHGWIIPHHNYLKADGQPYKSPREFYLKNGFDVLYSFKLETEKVSAIKIEWKNRTPDFN